VLGAAATTVFSYLNGFFVASAPQLASIVVIVALLVVAAFRLPRGAGRGAGRAPSPWLVFGVTLGAGVVFELHTVVRGLPVWVTVVALLVSEAGMAVLALT
jgi:hypothetical protein